ncbi:hypothetical protein ACEPAF_2804 [Sanghuangporus sanghuang]
MNAREVRIKRHANLLGYPRAELQSVLSAGSADHIPYYSLSTMSSKGSASPSPSPSLPAESHSNDAKDKAKDVENSREESESPEEGSSRQRSESPESTSDASKSPSSERDAAPETSSSNKTAPPEPSSSNAGSQSGAAVPGVTNALVQGDWQAIWSPQHGMYYFHNLRTSETTWSNPLVPSDASSAANVSTSSLVSAQEAAAAAGIDPDLAYLDPALVAGPSAPAPFSYTAKFNARTGAFASPDARDPEHVSEYERMKRMSNFYFDMDEWQKEVEQRQEEEATGKKRKKPTKKDLEMFKERKKQKKLAKTAWLRT